MFRLQWSTSHDTPSADDAATTSVTARATGPAQRMAGTGSGPEIRCPSRLGSRSHGEGRFPFCGAKMV